MTLRVITCFLLAALMAGCGGPILPYAKDEPTGDTKVHPPWEALVEAGPGAENDLDLETLNGPLLKPLEPAPLRPAVDPAPEDVAVAEEPTTAVADAAPEPEKAKPKKKGVAIRAVAVPAVTGAPGKGNAELAAAMRDVLKGAGWPVVASRKDDALTVSGKVVLGKVAGDSQPVRLVWLVATPDGKVLGEIKQENVVPAGSLDAEFGENARFAAEAAATGIFDLIQRFR